MRRLPDGGDVDRARPLVFEWDGLALAGWAGDTLASALLGGGVDVIGHSVSLGRPRGIMSAGPEEANAFAQVGVGAASEPLVRMTAVELYDGLVAASRSVRGRLPDHPDPARFEQRWAHCDLLVVGTGPAGLAAARVGAAAGLRVILAGQEPFLGGALARDRDRIDGRPAVEWVGRVAGELAASPDARILRATTALAALDQQGMILAERVGARLPLADRGDLPEQRLWRVRARAVVLATGALERPVVFQDNDRPGIMLATAARTYLNRFALVPTRGLVFTLTDDGYRTAIDWHRAGVPVAAIVDPRPGPGGRLARDARALGLRVITGVVEGTHGGSRGRLAGVSIAGPGGSLTVEADLLAVSGGFDPALGLHQQLGGVTRWCDRALAAVPAALPPDRFVAGAATGDLRLSEALAGGTRAALAALDHLGVTAPAIPVPTTAAEEPAAPALLWSVPAPDGDETRSFIDLHRDATVAGLTRALGAGIRHVEHLKRYTLIGTGIDQGRSARVTAGVLTALATGRPIAEVGASRSRPPAEPVLFGLMAGRARGSRYEPVRTTPVHEHHAALGAVLEPVGNWWRARFYPQSGESMEQAVLRECRAVRERVGMMDVSTLGRIDVQGPDAARFLDRLYTNAMGTLPPGKARYGLMCRLDGTILDDGVVLRLAEDRFFVTTTTGNAALVFDWMEEWLQTEWPDLAVWLTSVTEQWAAVAIAGPRSRAVMAALAPGLDVSAEGFPFMAVRRHPVAGIEGAMAARISFSGELAWEVSVPASFGHALWTAVAEAGRPEGMAPYGTEALHVLRAEKGYIIIGQETDGTTTPADAGLGWMVSQKKDFVGRRGLSRPEMTRPDRLQLVGFLPADPGRLVPEGAGLVEDPGEPVPMTVLGHVTASHRSVALGRSFGLAMVKGGRQRIGQTLYATDGGVPVPVTVARPVLFDPDGARRDG